METAVELAHKFRKHVLAHSVAQHDAHIDKYEKTADAYGGDIPKMYQGTYQKHVDRKKQLEEAHRQMEEKHSLTPSNDQNETGQGAQQESVNEMNDPKLDTHESFHSARSESFHSARSESFQSVRSGEN
jgi:hypothetical protein